jgi:hypothetical protein
MAANNLSMLGQPYYGLRATTSSFKMGPSTPPPENTPETAPITPADVPKIIEVLTPCPIGPYELRVPRQGSPGLCWQDSLFTMLWNADWFKPTLIDNIQFYMEQFFANGETDLVYAKEIEVEELNWNKRVYNAATGSFTGPTKKVKKINRAEKIKPIARAFKAKYGFGLPLTFWEYYCLNLHRYILLGYMFLKHSDLTPAPTAETKSKLLARRKSIAASNYAGLHTNFKESVFGEMYHGCSNMSTVRKWFLQYIPAVSGGQYELMKFSEPSVSASQIEGYYLGLDRRHVLSIFKCGGLWFVYDIDVGSTPFSAEDSAKLDASRIKSFVFQNDKATTFTYSLTLENSITIQVSMPLIRGYELKYNTLTESFSFILVRKSTGATAAAPAAKPNSNGGAASGGRRKTRKHRYSKRKLTRNRTYK